MPPGREPLVTAEAAAEPRPRGGEKPGRIVLWGRLSSINVQKVAWCLDEVGLDYERVDAGGAHGVVNTPEYRRLNPNGLIPVIEVDDFVLWESNAIVRYLASEYGGSGLWPRESRARADADRWMDWQATSASPGLRDAFLGLIRTPPAQRNHDAVARSMAAADACATILDEHLAGRSFLTGDIFTTADIVVGAHAHRWLNMPMERRPKPRLEEWYLRLKARPGAATILNLPVT